MFRRLLKVLREVSRELAGINCSLETARRTLGEVKTMALEINQLIDDINTETNRIAAKIEEIINQVHPGLTLAEADNVKARLGERVAHLKTVGADTANPIPEEPEPEPEP